MYLLPLAFLNARLAASLVAWLRRTSTRILRPSTCSITNAPRISQHVCGSARPYGGCVSTRPDIAAVVLLPSIICLSSVRPAAALGLHRPGAPLARLPPFASVSPAHYRILIALRSACIPPLEQGTCASRSLSPSSGFHALSGVSTTRACMHGC
ncbi:hypothetical protein BV20DRAFT_970758 [Pilatotrama ljubarskyi]|nr:hypothetical protein BV20DRAFT_970758 [Pilatotrama ljubarskyi]